MVAEYRFFVLTAIAGLAAFFCGETGASTVREANLMSRLGALGGGGTFLLGWDEVKTGDEEGDEDSEGGEARMALMDALALDIVKTQALHVRVHSSAALTHQETRSSRLAGGLHVIVRQNSCRDGSKTVAVARLPLAGPINRINAF